MESKVIVNYTDGEKEILDVNYTLEGIEYDLTANMCYLPIRLSNGRTTLINMNLVKRIEYQENEEEDYDDED